MEERTDQKASPASPKATFMRNIQLSNELDLQEAFAAVPLRSCARSPSEKTSSDFLLISAHPNNDILSILLYWCIEQPDLVSVS
jgi:hypothetical protein